MRFAALFLLALFLLPTAAPASPLDDGIAAFNRHDYPAALKLLKPLAEQGNAEAQYQIGYMYLYGQGVPQDYTEAYFWLSVGAKESDENTKNAVVRSAGRNQILKHLSPEQVEAVKKRIEDWKPLPTPDNAAPAADAPASDTHTPAAP